MTDKRILQTADFIASLNPIISMGFGYLPELKKTLAKLEKMKSNIVSGAAIIGDGYRKKEINCEYRIKRLKALIGLLEAYKESEDTIKEIESIKGHDKVIDKLFGI